MLIQRYYHDLGQQVMPGKTLLLLGPRQAGKTTLVKQFLATTKLRSLLVGGDSLSVQQTYGSQEAATLLRAVEGYDLLVIDEAQRVPGIGWSLKILVDNRPDLSIIATGSASFELLGQTGEPLTGRKKNLTLFPVAELELAAQHNAHELDQTLPDRLLYGSYPAVLSATSISAKKDVLDELLESYLLKDILELERVKASQVLRDLLRLLAFQVGSEVSLSELASQLQIDAKTVARYVDLFEKSYILYSLRGYSRNLRKEVTKMAKYYFYDVGIRNAIINNFNSLDQRHDVGQLWENYAFMERQKARGYHGIRANTYFWRTWEGQEIDLVEERDGRLYGYELKWNTRKRVKEPPLWQATYPEASWQLITPGNYHKFVSVRSLPKPLDN